MSATLTDTGLETGQHTYVHRGAATALFRSRFPEILLSGPAGTGKSMACLTKLMLQAVKYPGMRGLIIRKTLVSLGSTALVTWREKVISGLLKSGQVWFYGGSAQEPAQYRFGNGSVIVIGGLDKSTKIMSSEYDVIYVQEAIELSEDDWEKLTTRLRHYVMPYQQLIADTNPDKPTHWLKARSDRGQLRMLESRHEDNPALYQHNESGELVTTDQGRDYIAKLDSLTGVRHNRLRRGQWVASEGIIYEQWDQALHVIDAMPKGWEDWPRYWSVDFGFVHPFVWQCWAVAPDGELYLYREYVRTGRTVDEHAEIMLREVTFKTDGSASPGHGRKGQWREPSPVSILCDHDAEGRETLERGLGMITRPARKAVTEGIQKVQMRLKPQMSESGEMRPRLYVLRNALFDRDPALVDALKPTCLADEIPGYIWAPDTSKAAADGDRKEVPLKEEDDSCDAMRYLVAEIDFEPELNIRWM
jgi:phage terminase large subunit